MTVTGKLMEYNDKRWLVKHVSRYNGSAFGNEALSKIIQYQFGQNGAAQTEITTLAGQEIGRRYLLRPTDYEAKVIVAQKAGAGSQ